MWKVVDPRISSIATAMSIGNAAAPRAAVAYHQAFMTELATSCGFREVTVAPRRSTTELVAGK